MTTANYFSPKSSHSYLMRPWCLEQHTGLLRYGSWFGRGRLTIGDDCGSGKALIGLQEASGHLCPGHVPD